jgi:hypothetical protein
MISVVLVKRKCGTLSPMWEKIQKLGKKSVLVIPIALLLRIIFVCIELIFKVKIQIYELPKRFGHLLVEPDIFLAKESGVTEKNYCSRYKVRTQVAKSYRENGVDALIHF